MSVIQTVNLTKFYGKSRGIENVNLSVEEGEIFGFIGPNGAGKSTMMKCLFGTYQKDEGTIFLEGKEINFSGPK